MAKLSSNKKTLRIRQVRCEDLKPYENNARTHSEAQIEQLCASLREFGWTNPILIDGENTVIAGHARMDAAKKLGMVEVPTIALVDLTEAQRKAYIIADNKLALNAGWDEPLLGAELMALDSMGFDCELTGFSGTELEGLFARAQSAGEGLTDEDAVPEAQEQIVSRVGDVWLCGRHRVRCGDSTVATDVEVLLAGVEPHLMVTDPPYGVDYKPGWRNEAVTQFAPSISARVENDDRVDWSEAWALFPGDVAYVWHAATQAVNVAASLGSAKFECRTQIIWAKQNHVIGRGHYHPQHEPCWYAVRKGTSGHWCGGRTQTTLWRIENLNPVGSNNTAEDRKVGHGTQKPVECMRRPIVNNSSPGQAVYDPFLGSGTTMIAAEKEARACYGMEIAPQYVDVAVRRWQDFTGKEATLEGDGRTFNEIAEQGHVAGGEPDERGGGVRPSGADTDPGVSLVRAAGAVGG